MTQCMTCWWETSTHVLVQQIKHISLALLLILLYNEIFNSVEILVFSLNLHFEFEYGFINNIKQK